MESNTPTSSATNASSIGRLDSTRTSDGQERNKKALLRKFEVFLLHRFRQKHDD